MERAVLGATGIEVSRMCFGTLTMGPLQRDMPPEQGAELLVYAYQQGVNFMDTAEIYANYTHIKLALQRAPGYRVSTKAYCYDEATAEKSFEAARRGLDRDFIDLFLIHEQESIHTLRGHKPALDYLHRMKAQGKIGAVGISTHYVGAVEAAIYFGGIDVIHPLINMCGLGIADGSREQMEQAISKAAATGIGIYAMKPLGGGHLISKREQAIDYALGLKGVASIAIGMQCVEEIDCNVALFNGLMPPDSAVKALQGRSRQLLINDWCEGCARCVRRCKSHALHLESNHAVVEPDKCVLCGYCASVCPQFCIKVM